MTMDDFFRSQQSPRGDSQLNSAFVSPPRNGPLLPRRFTTDSSRVPTLSSITPQRGPEPQDFSQNAALHKVQLLEKKRLEYEKLREQKRRFEAEMHKLDAQQRQEERELVQMQEDLRFGGNGMAGHQSEPTTPPEYRETSSGFPTMFSRPNRYSTSSLTSPPGLYNRPGRSGSQLASPPSGIIQSRFAFDDQLPSRSVPGSRRNSDEDEKEEAVRQDPTSHRSTNALNRYSMPVTRSRTYMPDSSTDNGLDGNNTTGFLFGDEDAHPGENNKHYTQPGGSDNFPTLVRREGFPTMLSASSAALDLTNAQVSTSEQASPNGWVHINRHRAQQSLSTLTSTQVNGTGSASSGPPSEVSAIGSRPSTMRHSLDLKFYQDNSPNASDNTTSVVSPTAGIMAMTTPPTIPQSFVGSDASTPTKNGNGAGSVGANANTHAMQHFHNHNASMGRIPAGAMPHRHSRELSNENLATSRESSNYPSIGSTLQANAAPFGPPTTQAQSSAPFQYFNGTNFNGPASNGPTGHHYPQPPLMAAMQALNISTPNGPMYSPPVQTYNGGYNQPYGGRVHQDSQARVIQSRRQLDNEAMSRYAGLPLEAVAGDIYNLCKDQHGCRYLQKQLENRIPSEIHMIWLETNQHVVELMTDPFGNYLCQKLFEYCNDEERTVLIQNASQDMVRIALNQHGTRALQKMIEFVSSPEQIGNIVEALRHRVVELIQDLNGNHVIQKCLNKLSPNDAQFIFDAVGNNCIDVGTHRHGCCVLQRCIDHASGDQKIWLIGKITENAVALVQDPFGNYVVQYIIDLNDPSFTEPLVHQFRGRIIALSRHKFSSNVVEKCLRCAKDASRDLIVEELLTPNEMDRLLRDSYANYVIQTALEYATPYRKVRLVDTIRPILPNIRGTPYGRRIQSKVTAFDNRGTATGTNQVATTDMLTQTQAQAPVTMGQVPARPPPAHAMSNGTSTFQNGVANPSQGPTYPLSSNVTVPSAPQRPGQYPPHFHHAGGPSETGGTPWV